ncbi:MAG: alpha/beta hydrolase [Saprospiraceae bacterium]|nr:alpha/beta hydrolase [Saprospiraceae bacterium]
MKYVLYSVLVSVLLITGCVSQRPTQVRTMADIGYPFPVRQVVLDNDLSVAYMDEGTGDQTLLFIHGLGSYAPAWKKNMDGLKNEFRCIAIDLPGYGHSSKGDYPGDMRFYADIVAQLIHKLDLAHVTLVGHSMGGQIAVTTGLGYPELIDQLVLVAPAGYEQFTNGQRQWFREILTSDAVRLTTVNQIRENFATNFYRFPKDAEFMIQDRIAMRTADDFRWYCDIIPKNVRGMVNDPVYDFLPNLTMPVLSLFGEYDNLIPNRFLNGGSTLEIARQGSSRIPQSVLIMIEKAGHFVQFEKSDEVNAAIRGFLKA